MEGGGKLLIASAAAPEFTVAPVIADDAGREGLLPRPEPQMFPSLTNTDLVMLNGPFTEVEGDGSGLR